jgi:hypothetical protein
MILNPPAVKPEPQSCATNSPVTGGRPSRRCCRTSRGADARPHKSRRSHSLTDVRLEHDPEKWAPVFGNDHAPTISWSGMTIRRKVIPLHSAQAAEKRTCRAVRVGPTADIRVRRASSAGRRSRKGWSCRLHMGCRRATRIEPHRFDDAIICEEGVRREPSRARLAPFFNRSPTASL